LTCSGTGLGHSIGSQIDFDRFAVRPLIDYAPSILAMGRGCHDVEYLPERLGLQRTEGGLILRVCCGKRGRSTCLILKRSDIAWSDGDKDMPECISRLHFDPQVPSVTSEESPLLRFIGMMDDTERSVVAT